MKKMNVIGFWGSVAGLIALVAFGFSGKRVEEDKVEALLSRMTLEEKIGQMTQGSGSPENYLQMVREGKMGSLLNISGAATCNAIQRIAVQQTRLGIPLIFGLDVIHGYKTIFPIPLAEACTWDPELVGRAAAVAAREARAAGIHWTFAPMVDIARDPRWGRIAEGSGEDPFLGSAMARARVIGFQGPSLSPQSSLVACAKHYVGYGAAEAGRDYNTVDMSLQTLHDVYLPPFRAAVEAGTGTLMSAFNCLNGVPTSANRMTLIDILRKEWKFDGFVVSDWNSIGELINHGIAGSPQEAGIKALTAGVDMDMETFAYARTLAQAVKDGKVSVSVVDESVRRILRIKVRLGLFENPYADSTRESAELRSGENLQTALDVAHRSIVLLENEKRILPLSKTTRTLAVVGPLADSKTAPLGCWSCGGEARHVVSVLEGIRSEVPSASIRHARGCDVNGSSKAGFDEAVKAAKASDAVLAVVGEDQTQSGEAASRAYLGLPGVQEDLIRELVRTGKPVVVILMNGRPLALEPVADMVSTILEIWHLGTQCGTAVADVVFGDVNPSGRLPVTFPRTVGQVPLYYNPRNTGRPVSEEKFTSKYIDTPNTPLFPFGYGLTYSSILYEDFAVNVEKGKSGNVVKASVRVSNKANRDAEEVVQLYIQDKVASLSRPVRELKGFQRIRLAAGEVKTVAFEVPASSLGFYDENLKYVVEPGEFRIWIGTSSVEGLEGEFVLEE